jgi:hypothetical protein
MDAQEVYGPDVLARRGYNVYIKARHWVKIGATGRFKEVSNVDIDTQDR